MSIFGSYAIGRLTADPTVREVKVGTEQVSVCEFSLAVNYGYGDNEKSEFVNCIAWRKLADIIGTHCKKGRKIYVSGHQQTRNYETEKEGVTFKQYRTEWIIDEFEFCDSAPESNSSSHEEQAPAKAVKKTSPF